jgi:hypothetical protein
MPYHGKNQRKFATGLIPYNEVVYPPGLLKEN